MIRILLAEDQAMVRGALSALLGLESDIEVLGTAADGETAWRELQRLQTRRAGHRHRDAGPVRAWNWRSASSATSCR